MTLNHVQRAIADFREGRFVVVVDDADRENEGDLCIAAEKITPDAVNFMAKHARGLICLALTEERLQKLDIPMMVEENTCKHGTAFTVSIEAREGVSTGISAADRARTIQVAMDPSTKPTDLVRPGHVFPLRARAGGVLVRSGHTEATVDLARLASLQPGGVLCEIMNDDGTMARLPDLRRFAKKHHLVVVTIEELIQYRSAHESLVRRLSSKEVQHPVWGKLNLTAYGTSLDHREHLVITMGDVVREASPLVRVQATGPFGDVLDDLLGNARREGPHAFDRIAEEGCGVMVCLSRSQPRISLSQRLEGLHGEQQELHDKGSTVQREIGIGAQVLRDLGLRNIRVLTDHPRRLMGLEGYGLHVDAWVSVSDRTAAAASGLKLVK